MNDKQDRELELSQQFQDAMKELNIVSDSEKGRCSRVDKAQKERKKKRRKQARKQRKVNRR